jgi:hypothetical protein
MADAVAGVTYVVVARNSNKDLRAGMNRALLRSIDEVYDDGRPIEPVQTFEYKPVLERPRMRVH